jgi:hypothetical protein
MTCALCRPGQVAPEPPPPLGAPVDPWISTSGNVAHPNAPLGGGGTGAFRSANALGSNTDPFGGLPNPQAPAARTLDPTLLDDKAEQLADPPQLPAPVVSADSTSTVNGVNVTILKDVTGVKGITGAVTSLDMDAGTIPAIEFDDKTTKVTKITDPLPVISAKIGTRYNGDPNGRSAYGRGTTIDDKSKGNTSLGFHESCHRKDHVDFIKANALPKFGGKVGQTQKEFTDAGDVYEAAVEAYQKKSDQNSLASTDEVGNPTKSKFDSP